MFAKANPFLKGLMENNHNQFQQLLNKKHKNLPGAVEGMSLSQNWVLVFAFENKKIKL